MIVVGSFARGDVDPLSDLDLVLVAPEDGFEAAWATREQLHGGSALVCWDQRDPGFVEAGAHKWITRDLVLVECLLTTVSSGVRLLDRFPRRPPITRAEMEAQPLELHQVERTYDELKTAARAAFTSPTGPRGRTSSLPISPGCSWQHRLPPSP